MTAEPAIAVYAPHPGDSNAGSGRQIRGCAFNDFSNDLMSRNDAGQNWREVAFDDMEICAAHATGDDL
jgi:hypothetical protein